MISLIASERPSCDEIIDDKRRWLIEIKEISDDPQLQSIVVNKDNIDNDAMNPLSHYILFNKLITSKEREFESYLRNINVTVYPKNWDCFRIYAIENFYQITDAILSNEFTIYSNLDEQMQCRIIEVVKHAFTFLMDPEFICNFIAEKLRKIYDSGRWNCFFDQITEGNREFTVINWDNLKNINIHLNLIENTPYLNGLKMMIYNYTSDDSKESLNISINEYDSEITNSLIKFIDETRMSYQFTESEDWEGSAIEVSPNLSKLRLIVADESAFYYMSRDRKFLFYYQQFNNCYDDDDDDDDDDGEELTASIKCKFVATIGKLRFAVFTYLCDCKLYIGFDEKHDHICDMYMNIEKIQSNPK
jgi:hypothetical protein